MFYAEIHFQVVIRCPPEKLYGLKFLPYFADAYLKPYQISKMKLFEKTFDS